jgi:hypothetical protein
MPTNSRQVVNGVAYDNMDKLARKYTGQLTGTEPITIEPMKYIKLDDLTIPVTMVDGVPQYTGDTAVGYSYGCGRIPCVEGDVFTINGHGGSQARLWGFIDDEGNILDRSGSGATGNNKLITAPEDAAWLIVHTDQDGVSFRGQSRVQDLDLTATDVSKPLPHRNTSPTGFTFTWDGNVCTVNGQRESGTGYNFLCSYEDPTPAEIVPGRKYMVHFIQGANSGINVIIHWKLESDDVVRHYFQEDAFIEVPEDIVGITVGLQVRHYNPVDNVKVEFQFILLPPQEEGLTDISSGSVNPESHMLSVGSSFMTGLVYIDDGTGVAKQDHRASFPNSPYGNVAIELGIEEKNVLHILLGGTGLLYDNGEGNILNKIKSIDLAPYDYILTEVNRPDMGQNNTTKPGYPLGDLTSTAGDGSIVGAVLELLAYMKTSNPNATLILVGAPPSDQREGWSYQDVFTVKYYGGEDSQEDGYSIADCDLMLHRLAVREHFIFVDWEDLNISYYYPDFCDDGNVHPNNDATLRMMGMHLARNLNNGTSLARVLKADAEG